MLRYRFLIGFILLANTVLQAQKIPELINDFSVSLHEETVNKVLLAIGDITGTSDYEVMFIKGKYNWIIKNPKINIRPDSSSFTCDALVKTGYFSYTSNVVGDVKISYDSKKNLIYIKISRAVFELYTYAFGKRVHIKDIHLEERFKEPFAFEGPKTITTVMDFPMPDSTRKKIFIQPVDCTMQLKWKEICTACEVAASELKIAPVIKAEKPIEAVKSNTTGTVSGKSSN